MSTRGLYGIRKNGVDKCTYNHSDSYPSYLGFNIVSFCKESSIENLNIFFDNIEIVDELSKPTEKQKKYCEELGLANFSVASQSNDDWYCLLRNLQGNFALYYKYINDNKRIFMIDNSEFIKDSLFCEYAYIINLDKNVLEFYKGFQTKRQNKNRYGVRRDENGYYPCRLIKEFSLDDIFNNDPESIVSIMNKSHK